MGRVLATTVILTDETTGEPLVFLEGDLPKKKYADQIVNPKAWKDDESDDGEDDESEDVDPTPDPDPAADPGDPDGEDDEDEDEDDDTEEDKAPAKSAKVDVWKAYAESKGIELADDATKKDYQDAVAAL